MPLAMILIGGVLSIGLRYLRAEPSSGPRFEEIPLELSAYHGTEERFPDYQYDILKADTTTLRRYQDSAGVVYWLFVAYFSSQKYGSQIHSPRHCLPGGGWRIESQEAIMMSSPSGAQLPVNSLVIDRENEKQLMLYWFETRSGAIRSEFALKGDLALNSMRFRPTDAAFVRITVWSPDSKIETALTAGRAFVRDFDSVIHRSLPFARS